MKKKKKIFKSSQDGRFVSKEDLEDYPASTYEQTVEVKPRRKKATDAETVETDVEIMEQGE